MRGDLTRCKQALLNLLSNAVKYNYDEGKVTLSLARAAPGMLHFEVVDTGPGIPPERQGGLLQPFSRLGAETTGIEGTGIGLSVTRELIEHMDGAIGFESEPGQGSRFWIDLPLA